MLFSDIHTHLLYGVDDGPKSREEMFAMADKLYADGVRLLCATPHCFPEWCGNNRTETDKAFAELCEYCAEKYPDLKLFLGNELYYEKNEDRWLDNGFCKTMGNSRYVLVEFPVKISGEHIIKGAERLLSKGYIPIIAHTERYSKLKTEQVEDLRKNGVVIQINSRDSFGGFDLSEKRRLKSLLSKGLADVVSTDAHDLGARRPNMPKFYSVVAKKYGAEYAEDIFRRNAEKILCHNKTGD